MADENLSKLTKTFLNLIKKHGAGGKTIASLAKFASDKTMDAVGNLNKEEIKLINESLKKENDTKVPGNLNKEELAQIQNPTTKQGKTKSKANPGDAGGSIAKLAKGGFPDLSGDGEITQKDILMGKGVIKMKKGGIVKKKSSRSRIAKRGFGIAKRGY
jgi:hypothetical protein